MFFYSNWDKFCEEVKNSNVKIIRAKDILSYGINEQFIVFKHDVETNPQKALILAKIENKYGICGSYYVQAFLLDRSENVRILKQIKKLGHEVSYHYDVLDANFGDFEKANKDFKYNLDRFNKLGFKTETVCQHGNPVMNRVGYTSNRDFFRHKLISDQYKNIADIVVNFKEKTGVNYTYVSDAGYSWKLISDPENNDKGNTTPDIQLNGFNGIMDLIDTNNSIILSTHPHRWKKSRLAIYWKILFFRSIRSIVKVIRKIPFMEEILSRFYYLAKNI